MYIIPHTYNRLHQTLLKERKLKCIDCYFADLWELCICLNQVNSAHYFFFIVTSQCSMSLQQLVIHFGWMAHSISDTGCDWAHLTLCKCTGAFGQRAVHLLSPLCFFKTFSDTKPASEHLLLDSPHIIVLPWPFCGASKINAIPTSMPPVFLQTWAWPWPCCCTFQLRFHLNVFFTMWTLCTVTSQILHISTYLDWFMCVYKAGSETQAYQGACG